MGLLAPCLIANLEDQVLNFVWSLSCYLLNMVEPTGDTVDVAHSALETCKLLHHFKVTAHGGGSVSKEGWIWVFILTEKCFDCTNCPFNFPIGS